MAHPVPHQDTLAVPDPEKHTGLNQDLVKILRENLLQQERPRNGRHSHCPASPPPIPPETPRASSAGCCSTTTSPNSSAASPSHTPGNPERYIGTPIKVTTFSHLREGNGE
ncbi:hypothetical protein SKAU_G00016220 [Synaphobranchus kaupii]|uniref:Uncharacterized protein n=1 Tax=Synaphobranchus kaupii TaxID=118154 RepID=A0A9Q1GC85_SYNKA|nr:hypothetical protein SKAU_G00016220 [Synaphobranchus kaupii]